MKHEANANRLSIFRELSSYLNDNTVTQDVNSPQSHLLDNSLVKQFLKTYVSTQKIRNVIEVQSLRLVESIMPHDDTSFIRSSKYYKRVLVLITTDTEYNGEYYDSPDSSYFYVNSKWAKLKMGDVFWFDATKEHAIITAKPFNMATFWFRK